MCYNASLTVDLKAMKERFHRLLKDEEEAYGLPLSDVTAFARPWWPAITAQEPEVITRLQWGLIPPFARQDPKNFLFKTPTFNAVSEEAWTKRSFMNSLIAGRRCLIPVTSFREWQHRAIPGKKAIDKVPFSLTLKNEPIFSLAGIYETDGSFSILTTRANTLMTLVHNKKKRMPVIIPRAFEGDWLSPNLQKEDVDRFCGAIHEWDLEGTAEREPVAGSTLIEF